jgi:hypothetical protein
MKISRAERARRESLLAQGLKECRRCLVTLPTTEFARSRSQWDGLQSRCRDCDSVCRNAHHKQNPGRSYTNSVRRHQVDPYRARIYDGARKAREFGCEVVQQFSSAELLSYWEAQGIDPTRCYYTGEELGADFHLDHMTPLSQGGAHAVWNIVPCSPVANMSKQDRTAEEYLSAIAA